MSSANSSCATAWPQATTQTNQRTAAPPASRARNLAIARHPEATDGSRGREAADQLHHAVLLRGAERRIDRQAENPVGVAPRVGSRPWRLAECAHRRLLRDERAVVDERFHAVFAQVLLERVALPGPEHVRLVDAALSRSLDRDVPERREQFVVAEGEPAARLGLRVEPLQVHAQQRGLQLIQARVVAEELAA